MQRFLLAIGLALALVAIGCSHYDGPPLDEVTGTVTKDGKPLAGATLEFYPTVGGAPSYGKSNQAGEFKLRYSTGEFGAVAGTHRVSVIGGNTSGEAAAKNVDADGNEFMANPDAAPKRGQKPRQGIEVEVNAGEPTHLEIAL